MAGEKEIPEKLYFSIGEVSEITQLPSHVLRFWEDKFPLLHPYKSRGGHRRYQKRDIELILTIKDLLYNRGFTVEGARRELQDKRDKREREVANFNLAWLKEEIREIIKLLG